MSENQHENKKTQDEAKGTSATSSVSDKDVTDAVSEEDLELFKEEKLRVDQEHVQHLIDKTPGNKKIILETLSYCLEPRLESEVETFMAEIRSHNYTIYTPVELRVLMEAAGALEYTPGAEEQQDSCAKQAAKQKAATHESGTEEETQNNEATNTETQVDEDGNLVIPASQEGKWQTSESGKAYLLSDPFAQASEALIQKDAAYAGVYVKLLSYLNQSPRVKADIDKLIDPDPRVQKPRRFAGYFLSELEKADAAEWIHDAWHITERGTALLAKFSSIEEDK